MNELPLHLRRGSASLLSVPAVHFRAAFAEEVNRLCGDPDTRPDALAVELGPLTAVAARAWLTELGIGPSQRQRLPCMLGLVKPNRYLRPSVRERAIQLQLETGKELHELSPELLHRELGYAAVSVLFLSPTDSMIEAVRCACELAIPLYGVDLEERAIPLYSEIVLPDPATASGQVADYVRHNVARHHSPYDEEIDPRRETVMAARLKALLERYQRVLFTGGLGHWQRVARLVADDALKPARTGLDPIDTADLQAFQRTVIHPGLAVGCLDVFPAVATAFEQNRCHPLLDGAATPPVLVDYQSLLDKLLQQVYENYFETRAARPLTAVQRKDWYACAGFEQLLRARTLLEMRVIPPLALIVACACATMSKAFCSTLVEMLTDFPWANPGEYAGHPLLQPGGAGSEGRVCWVDGEQRGQEVYANIRQGEQPLPTEFPVVLEREWLLLLPDPRDDYDYHFTWRPWEHLVTALCHQAITRAKRKRHLPCSDVFQGQLLDGIDVKATVRAHARGEEQIWVRDMRAQLEADSSCSSEGYPVVWIFDEDPAGEDRWTTYYNYMSWLESYARDPAAFRRRYQQKGFDAADIIGFGRNSPAVGNLANGRLERFEFRGLIAFGPVFSTCRQVARWFEFTNFGHNPFEGVTGLTESLEFTPGQLRWQDHLIRLAIPYAEPSITVVAPAHFRLAPILYQEAARQGKNIHVVPLNGFPESYRTRLRLSYMVPAKLDRKDGKTVYTPEAEQVIGEALDLYRELVPPQWLTFGLDE